MNNEQLQVFVDGVMNYFETLSSTPAQVGTPFLIDDMNEYLEEYTGFIGISGKYQGIVFFTSPKAILLHLLASYNVKDVSSDNMLDLVGEIANTISGNARRTLGDEFMLSVPVVMRGEHSKVKVTKTFEIYVIPIIWRQHRANVIINLNI
ncbi:MAG: chemotaxis protein CheX [Gammaproteobacteria bacterium]